MRILLLFLLFSISFSSCERPELCDEPKIDCSNIHCFAFLSHFEFKVVDKTNGNDLVFGSNPRYQTGDIKLYYDAARTFPIQLTVDNDNKKFTTIFSKDEMYLEIMGTDVYKLTADFKGSGCCSNRVKTLRIDGLMICSCCIDAIPVPVN